MEATALRGDGMEWIVEAFGCATDRLTSRAGLAALVDELMATLRLRAVAAPVWHQFPDPGGITGMVLLAESHLALHTFPEHGSITLNLFCCAPRAEWDWADGLARHLGATEVRVRRVEREYGTSTAIAASSPLMLPMAYGQQPTAPLVVGR